MTRLLLLLILLLYSLTWGQTIPPKGSQNVSPTNQTHVHPFLGPSTEINGATNPELIPDGEAYKMLFATIGQPIDALDGDKALQSKRLAKASLNTPDSQQAMQIFNQFRARYDDMIKNYNDTALALSSRGEVPDYEGFQRRLLALVKETRLQLEATLSADGVKKFEDTFKARRSSCAW